MIYSPGQGNLSSRSQSSTVVYKSMQLLELISQVSKTENEYFNTKSYVQRDSVGKTATWRGRPIPDRNSADKQPESQGHGPILLCKGHSDRTSV